MKNFRLLIILFAFITLISACKKDEEKPMATEQRVVGKWNLKKSTSNYYENNVLKESSEEMETAGDYAEFNSNKTIVTSSDGTLESGSYQILNDNTLTVTMDGETSTFTIDKLDSQQFIITTSFSDTFDGITYKYVITSELAKQ